MKIKSAPLGELGANFYIVTDDASKKAFAVDPGAEGALAADFIKDTGYELEYIIITHAHADHIGALDYLKSEYGNAKIVIHSEDAAALNDNKLNLCSSFFEPSPSVSADITVNGGSTLLLGENEIKFIHTPGHTPGSMCILADNFLISGDTLFHGSIGRCDFPGGDYGAIINSIKNKLFTLDDDVKVYPGHGNPTTIKYEKENNPFF